ncbi:MAG: TonB-dependent receptor, partial [Chitinophagaceae bacterium]
MTLVFSSVGYDMKEVAVSSAAANIEIDFSPVATLGQEVVVGGSRTPQRLLESPVTIERLGAGALRNAAAPNYYEAIANLKGVDMHTASLTFRTITTRGFISSGNTRMNQLIDGMDNQAPGLNFSVGNIVGLTELDVDNIELLSGASSALYGSGGMNGTLLINSKNPFKYQGLSFNIKQGIMHVDGKQRSPAPYYDWTMRWAKNINNKFAFKLAWQMLKAEDWQANDTRNVARTNVLSKLTGGDRNSDPNYDGINVYGDETSANMLSVTQSIQSSYVAGIAAASGGFVPNVVQTLNALIPANASYANAVSIINANFVGPLAALAPTVRDQLLPFYWGLRNNWVPNQNVSRTGYNEKDLVDYNSLNFKITAGLHYKITPGIEASWNTYFGTGTTVYTGADRYSLRNFKMAQHKIEIRHKNWFVRGYTTQENAGESYNATVLGRLMQEAFRPSGTGSAPWYPTYIGNFIGYKLNLYNAGTVPSDYNAHLFARTAADVGRPVPGTPQFEALKKQIRTTAIPAGAKFLDRSDLYAIDGQFNISDAFGFSKAVEIIGGGGWKQYVLNSQGTIFADTAGKIKVHEIGTFLQLKKDLGEFLTLTAAGRFDKHSNFQGRVTPRFTAVIHATKDHNIRLSYQTAYRFPANQDQYINLNVGSGILIGALPEFQDYYKLNSTNPGYTAESIIAYRNSGNPANTNLLVQAQFKEMEPESVYSG